MQHFDKINENTWTFTCFQINMPFLHKENIIIILESSNYFGMKHTSFDFRSSSNNKHMFFTQDYPSSPCVFPMLIEVTMMNASFIIKSTLTITKDHRFYSNDATT